MIWLIFLFFYIFVNPTFAATTITLTDFPSSITIGESFSVTFIIDTTSTSPSFFYKMIGTGVTLTPLPNTACANNYDNCPTVAVDASGSATATAFGQISVVTGPINVAIRIADQINHNATTSNYQPINTYVVPTPTNTPTSIPTYIPTATPIITVAPTPTLTPNPTLTPSPTSTPFPTSTPKPSATMTPIPTPTVFPTVTPDPIPSYDPIPTDSQSLILGDSISINTTSSSDIPPSNKFNTGIIPLILIILGSIILTIPVVVSKIKLKNK